MSQLRCLRPWQFQHDDAVRSAVEALRKTRDLPQQLHLFLPDQSARIMPTSYLQLLPTVLRDGTSEGKHPFSIKPLFMCLCLSFGTGSEKVIPFCPRVMGHKSYFLARSSKLINYNLQRFHSQRLKMRPSHRTSEIFRDRRTARPSAQVLQDKVSPSYQNSCA